MITVSIVIPAYNEERRLPATLEHTIEYLNLQQYESEILVVNDGSTDKTKEVTELFKNKFPNLVLIEYFPNKGKGFAVKTGMLKAKGKYRLFMDADYAVPIEYLSKFIQLLNDDKKIIIGSRAVKDSIIENHQSFFREKIAKLFGLIQRTVLKLPIMDTQCGFKLFNDTDAEHLFNQIKFDCAYFDAELLYLAYKSGYKIDEVGVKWKHDEETRLPIGIKRSIDLWKKLFMIKKIHK